MKVGLGFASLNSFKINKNFRAKTVISTARTGCHKNITVNVIRMLQVS